MGKEKKSSPQNNDTAQPVPNIDDLISHITNNGNFKTMMDSISDGLQDTNYNVSNSTDKTNNTENTENTENTDEITSNPFYDIMSTFLTNSEGDNITDVLTNINNNLTKLVERQ